MPFDLDPGDARPLYVQIMEEIRSGIALGTWKGGELLPSARELALELRVNPNTVKQAYRQLEEDGVVEGQRGRGTFVRGGAEPVERRRLLQRLIDRIERDASRYGISMAELIEELESRSDPDAGVREAG